MECQRTQSVATETAHINLGREATGTLPEAAPLTANLVSTTRGEISRSISLVQAIGDVDNVGLLVNGCARVARISGWGS